MARESRIRKNEEIGALEAAIRSSAGLGAGYAVLNNYRTIYDQVKRSFLGLPISGDMKRTFTKLFQFSGMDFQKTALDVSLSNEKYLSLIPDSGILERTVIEVEKQNKDIRFKLQNVSELIRDVQNRSINAARQFGAESKSYTAAIDNLVTSFDEFSNDYFEKAVSSAEQATEMAFAGRGNVRTSEILRELRLEQVQAVRSRLGVIRERLGAMGTVIAQTRGELTGIWNRGELRRAQHITERTTSGQMTGARDIAREILDLTETHIKNATTTVKGLTDISLTRPEAIQDSTIKSKMWAIKGDVVDLRRQNTLRKLIGTEGFRSISSFIGESFHDPFGVNAEDVIFAKGTLVSQGQQVRDVKSKFFKYVAETIRQLDRTDQFESFAIETTRGPNNQVVIRAVAKDPALFGSPDLLLRYDVPQTTLGVKQIKRGVKDFFVPFQQQRDILLEQARSMLARQPWDLYNTGSAQELATQIQHQNMIKMTQRNSTTLSDMMTSNRLDTKLTHFESKVYQGGFDNLRLIQKNKMARGGIIHIDTEFGKGFIPTQVGWTVTDSKGKIVSVKQFNIGSQATIQASRAHVVGKFFKGKPIVSDIAEDQVDTIVKALVEEMNNPMFHGHPVQIAAKNFSGAEAEVIPNLIKMAERSKAGVSESATRQLRSALTQAVIDTNYLPGVSGNIIELKGSHLFRLIQDHVAQFPDLKNVVLQKLQIIGITDLGETGLRMFEKGGHTAVQDSYIQALYADIIYLKNIFTQGNKNLAKMNKAMDSVLEGFIPREFLERVQRISGLNRLDDIAIAAANVSQASYLGGRRDITGTNLAGPASHIRKGADNRPFSSQQLRFLGTGKGSADRRIQKAIGEASRRGLTPDLPAIIKGVLNDIQTLSVVGLDPNVGIGKDEFILSNRYLRRAYRWAEPEVIELDKVEKTLKVGDKLGQGKWKMGTEDLSGKTVSFTAKGSGDTAIVRSIDRDGPRVKITIDRLYRISRQTPVLTGSGAAGIADSTLEELFPNIGAKFSSFRLADYATKEWKANPGAMVIDSFTFLFEHAGESPERQMFLRHIIKKKFTGGQGGAISEGFPIIKRRGRLAVGPRDSDWWRQFAAGYKSAKGTEWGMGAYIEVAEEYNQRVNGAFTSGQILIGAGRPTQITNKAYGSNVLSQYARFMSDGTAVEANVKIASRYLKRSTNPDFTKQIVGQVRGLLNRGQVFQAMKLMRPDIAAEARTVKEFLDKSAALFGFMGRKSANGELSFSAFTISHDPISLKDPNLLSNMGNILRGQEGMQISPAFLQALRNIRGSGKLFAALEDKIFAENIVEISRMFPHQLASASRSYPRFAEFSAREVSRQLGQFLARQETEHHIIAVDEIYRVHGRLMNRKSAIAQMGIRPNKFDEAIRKGFAELVTDPNVYRSSLVMPADAFEMTRMKTFQMAFGGTVPVRVDGVTQSSMHHRMLVVTSESDYFPVTVKNLKTGTQELRLLENPQLNAFRNIVNKMNAGIPLDPTSGEGLSGAVQDYYNLQNNTILKANLRTHLDSVRVPVAGLRAHAIFDLVNTDITLKQTARDVYESVFRQKQVSKDMFLHGKGILPGEGLVAGTDEKLIQMIQSLTDDDMKFSARRMTGNVKLLDKSAIHPRAALARWIAAGNAIEGGPYMGRTSSEIMDVLRQKSQTHMGMLQQIVNSKGPLGKEMTQGFQDAFMDGFVSAPQVGVKPPFTDPNKFIMSNVFRSAIRAEEINRFQQRWGGEVGKLVAQPFAATILGNIDKDGDFLQIIMDRKLPGLLEIMQENSNLPAFDPIITLADDTSKGMVTYNMNTHKLERSGISQIISAQGLSGLKEITINKAIITKQLAGIANIFATNVPAYLRRLLGGTGSNVANDIGQKNITKMMEDVFVAGGAMEEAILKGKAVRSIGEQSIADLFTRNDIPAFDKFRKGMLGGDINDPLIRKMTTKITGTEHLFPGTKGMSILDLMNQIVHEGNGDMWAGIAPEQRLLAMNARPKDLYGIRGALVATEVESRLIQDLPTRFNVEGQQKLMTSIKRNIQTDLGERNWKLASKGMGWMVTAGAVYTAFNLFRPDQNRFLGHMPGQGGEVHDYTFTRPEYNMQNLLNVPYANPYSKNRSYIVMDNPVTTAKLARFTNREKRDFFKIQSSMGIDQPRITSRETQLRTQRSHRQLLERFGSV